MKKLGLLLIACFAFAAISVAQNNIVKSLQNRNVPGAGVKCPFIRMSQYRGTDRFGVYPYRFGRPVK